MKTYTLIAGLLIAALNALVLVPALQPNAAYLVAASIALALWLALKAATAPTAPSVPTAATPAPPPPAPPAPAPSAPAIQRLTDAEAIALLAAFQSKGRLIDFLMDDVSAYSDAQVGAAARVVQQGCKTVLSEHFTIAPVSSEKEGSRVTVVAGDMADYALVGKVSGQPPFTGILAHKGWKATGVKLPRALPGQGDRLPPIAPAQVELR